MHAIGKLHMPHDAGLETVVDEALKLLRATLPAPIRIESRLSHEAPAVFADPTQVHQVVMNLGTNAAHAMRERGGVLMIVCEPSWIEKDRAQALGELKAGAYARLVERESRRELVRIRGVRPLRHRVDRVRDANHH